MNKWLEIPARERAQILRRASIETGLNPASVEKDWWVTMCLKALFNCKCSEAVSFKGGTSLSKCWHLIERMSEDIDIALDRQFLGLWGEVTRRKDITKIRQTLCSYVLNDLALELESRLLQLGLAGFKVNTPLTEDSSTDPQVIEVEYTSALPSGIDYIKPKVIIEIGARSMSEPVETVAIRSILAEIYPKTEFADDAVEISVASAGRTFLEKIFLIHEELQKASARIDRMSRHLYDIVMLADKPFARESLHDKNLYCSVVAHREKFTHISGIDYSHHAPQYIHIVPDGEVEAAWRRDYQTMQLTMIYGKSLSFDEIILRLTALQRDINEMRF